MSAASNRLLVTFVPLFAVAAVVASALFLEDCGAAPPDGGPEDFHVEAVLDTTRALCALGPRVIGTPAAHQAAAELAEQLRKIPGMEVDVQRRTGALSRPDRDLAYEVEDVVARLPGRSPDALLLSAHFDSVPGALGAADDAAAVGVIVETARTLAAAGPGERSLVLVLNGGEELGLVGAAEASSDARLAAVRAFVNVDAAGAGGRALLFRASAGAGSLLAAYGRIAHPFASSFAQDVIDARLVPNDTDFRVYAGKLHVPGLDFALIDDGYVYHSDRDRPDRLDASSVGHLGESVLTVARAWRAGSIDLADNGGPGIYFDVLGRFFFHCSGTVAAVLALLALLAAATAIVIARKRAGLSVLELVKATGWAAAVIVVAPLAAGVVAAIVAMLGRGSGWFAYPTLAILAYAPIGATAALAACALAARRLGRTDESRVGIQLAVGALIVQGLLLVASLAVGWRSGFIPFVWTIGLAAAVWATARGSRWRGFASWAAIAAGALILVAPAAMVFEILVPASGQAPSVVPADVTIAVVVALPIGILFAAAAHLVFGSARRPAVLGLAAASLAGTIAVAAVFPYTPARPKRLIVEQRNAGPSSRIVVTAADGNPRGAHELVEATGLTPTGGGELSMPTSEAATGFQVTSNPADSATQLHLAGSPTTAFVLHASGDALRGWSLSRPDAPPRSLRTPHLLALSPSGSAWDLRLDVPALPRELEISGLTSKETPELRSVLERLPPWTSAISRVRDRYRVTP